MADDIHAGAVGPVRNGLQVGGLAGVLSGAFTGDAVTSISVALGGAVLAALGSQARTTLREMEASGQQASFWRGLLLQIASGLGALLLMASTAHAATPDPRCTADTAPITIRWKPSAHGVTTSYRVYSGTESHKYGTPVDVALPTAGADGVMAAKVPLSGDRALFVAMTAVGPAGESVFSNEITIPPSVCGPTLLEVLIEARENELRELRELQQRKGPTR